MNTVGRCCCPRIDECRVSDSRAPALIARGRLATSYDEGVENRRRLLLVEDEPLVSALLGETLRAANFDVAVAESAVEGARVARKFEPDIAVLDINLGRGASGVDLAFVLHRELPGIALMLLTKHPDLRTAGFRASDVPPGCGFIRKDMIFESKHVVQAIEAVVAEQTSVRHDADPARPLALLTASQMDVLRMVAQGFTNAEIAHRRKTSERSVERLLNGVFATLGISGDGSINPRVEAVRQFISAAGTPERP